MTPKQTDQAEGFCELLEITGSSFKYGEHTFLGLIRTRQPKADGFDLTPGDDTAISIQAFRSAFPSTLPVIGDHFEDQSSTDYRVTRISRTPANLTVTFECEVLHHDA